MNNKNQQPVNLDKEARQGEQAFSFVKTFRPYRKRYTEKVNSAFGADWITNNHYLNNTVIEKAIAGAITAGYYLQATSDVFGLDIDQHGQHGKNDFNRFAKLDQAIDRLGKAIAGKVKRQEGRTVELNADMNGLFIELSFPDKETYKLIAGELKAVFTKHKIKYRKGIK